MGIRHKLQFKTILDDGGQMTNVPSEFQACRNTYTAVISSSLVTRNTRSISVEKLSPLFWTFVIFCLLGTEEI